MLNALKNQDCYPLSVVIATLGGDTLAKTIAHLNQGAKIPAEILICIPEKEANQVAVLQQQNVRVIRTPCRGQVAQRAYGLQRVSQSHVLQIDDDVELPPDDLSKLVQMLDQLGRGHAVAPFFRHFSTGDYITACHRGVFGRLQSLYALLVCGAPWGVRRMGVISPAGIGYGVDKIHCGREPYETQWLPGGCVLCHREDLITENYFPFVGKAFSEDLIHSVSWRQRGVRLWMIPNASCMTSVAPMPFSWSPMKADMNAHGFVVQLIGGQMWRLRLWFALYVMKQTLLSAFRWILMAIKLK